MNNLLKDPVSKCITIFAIPLLIQNLVDQLYNITDSYFVGRYISGAAIAAVGVTMPIIGFTFGIIFGISSGFNIFIAHFIGKDEKKEIARIIQTSTIYFIFSGIFFAILLYLINSYFFDALQVTPEVLPLATTYMNWVVFSFPFRNWMYGIAQLMYSFGSSKEPIYFLSLSVFLNIFLDYVFIFKFQLGIAGAAFATILAPMVGFIGILFFFNTHYKEYALSLNANHFSLKIFKEGFRLGLPNAMRYSLYWAGMLAITKVVNSFGTAAMAAYSLGSKMDSFVGMPSVYFGSALSVFTSQNLGAEQKERVRKGYHFTMKTVLLVTIALGILFFIFARQIIQIFTTDEDVIRIGIEYIYFSTSMLWIYAIMQVSSGGLMVGSGYTISGMLCSLLSLWIIRIPFVYLLSDILGFGTIGIWISSPIGWFAGAVFGVYFYYSGKWKNSNVLKIKR